MRLGDLPADEGPSGARADAAMLAVGEAAYALEHMSHGRHAARRCYWYSAWYAAVASGTCLLAGPETWEAWASCA